MDRFNLEPKTVVPLAANIALAGVALYLVRKNLKTKRNLEAAEKAKEQLHYEATHDELTGLLNVRGLEELLAEDEPPKAMLYIDGTNQKAVNDTISHKRGDEAIVGTAKVIKESLRPGDIAARIGGDEFLVLLNTKRRQEFQNEEYISPEAVLIPVIERIHQTTEAFLIENPDLKKSGFDIAVGGAIWQEGMSVNDLRRAAESAMYDSKAGQHQANGQYR